MECTATTVMTAVENIFDYRADKKSTWDVNTEHDYCAKE